MFCGLKLIFRAETKALNQGLHTCLKIEVNLLDLEVNSLVLALILQNEEGEYHLGYSL